MDFSGFGTGRVEADEEMSDTHGDNGLIVIQTCLALMRELEDSLRSSQTALLARDAAGTERCSREQVRLWQLLKALTGNPGSPAIISASRESRCESPPSAAELAELLCATAIRVQHLARVQLALLRRSHQFLNVLANWMADPETPYCPPQTAGGGPGYAAHAHRGF
jgi:hypothetical protein